ncbi:DUF791-domain-containing protein [Rickenella mellea]|uniref:Molybdate-anion transporter n=1 Tax=Rickenella mellea TaxID=50990 RepID=A0A4Y7Q613_9AGAM|nr:DUF791-domain-containing protein [Rickenella mellea]
MASTFYELQLFVLAAFCVTAVFFEQRAAKRKEATAAASPERRVEGVENGHGNGNGWKADHSSTAAAGLTRQYLIVYAIVMGADWLQGPYVYSLYREQYDFPERIVATLFVTGFLSAGITAPVVGAWADQHGRKRVCMAFCVTYTLACLCTLFPFLPILFFGRLLGGISTSILYSAFESWLVSSSGNLGLAQSQLSSILGRATLVNGFVATTAGIVSNKLVGTFETFTAPFIASGVLLLLAWTAIKSLWAENYGNGGGSASVGDTFQLKRLGHAWRIVSSDPTLLTLGLTQTCFEGSMYLFVFAWVPSLQDASPAGDQLPFGYIFSSFMIAMMLGSVVYTSVVSNQPPQPASLTARGQTPESSLTLHAKLSSIVCTVSAFALAVSVMSEDVRVRFWAFCLFEACVGMYYPVQGMLRGTLISNDHRATLSSLFRVPLNVFVVVALMTGVSSARLYVFSACSVVLAISAIMTGLIVVRRAEEMAGQTLRP